MALFISGFGFFFEKKPKILELRKLLVSRVITLETWFNNIESSPWWENPSARVLGARARLRARKTALPPTQDGQNQENHEKWGLSGELRLARSARASARAVLTIFGTYFSDIVDVFWLLDHFCSSKTHGNIFCCKLKIFQKKIENSKKFVIFFLKSRNSKKMWKSWNFGSF